MATNHWHPPFASDQDSDEGPRTVDDVSLNAPVTLPRASRLRKGELVEVCSHQFDASLFSDSVVASIKEMMIAWAGWSTLDGFFF